MSNERYIYKVYGTNQTFETESDMHEAITGWPLGTHTFRFRGGTMPDNYASRLHAEIWATAGSTRRQAHHHKLYRYIERAKTGR